MIKKQWRYWTCTKCGISVKFPANQKPMEGIKHSDYDGARCSGKLEMEKKIYG